MYGTNFFIFEHSKYRNEWKLIYLPFEAYHVVKFFCTLWGSPTFGDMKVYMIYLCHMTYNMGFRLCLEKYDHAKQAVVEKLTKKFCRNALYDITWRSENMAVGDTPNCQKITYFGRFLSRSFENEGRFTELLNQFDDWWP